MMNFIFCHSAMATASKKSWAALAAKPAVPQKARFVPQEHTSVHRKDGQPLPPYHPLEKLFSKTKKPIDTLHYQVTVTEKQFTCGITGKEVRGTMALVPVLVWFLNCCTLLLKPHHKYELPQGIAYRVVFYNPDGTTKGVWANDEGWFIVPKLPTSKFGRLLAARFCAKRLHHDAMSALIPYLGSKVKYYYKVVDSNSFDIPKKPLFPNDIYRVPNPKVVSIEGLLDQLKSGNMEVARLDKESYKWKISSHPLSCFCEECEKKHQIVALTPEAFRHIFPDGRPLHLSEKYGTVEIMLHQRECFIKKLEQAARGIFD